MTAPPTTAHYVATGMTCDHCRAAVVAEVTAIPGVASVDVDLAAGTVRVHGAGFDDAAVLAAIDEAGYDAVVA
jgi:copper chaperone